MSAPAYADQSPEARFDARAFFSEPWRGWGVVSDGFGAPIGGYEVNGQGREVDGARLEQSVTYDNGMVQALEWEILTDEGGPLTARDVKSGVIAQSRQTGDGIRWTYKMRAPTPIGLRMVKVEATYTMTGEGSARSVTVVSLYGFRLAVLTGEFRHITGRPS